MLSHLFVSNYALINNLSLDFTSGLTILTGETGAGKSILLGALKLVLGERADLKAIKNTEKKCIVEAHFQIKELGLKKFFEENDLDYEEHTILRREILPSGKSRAFVNDVPTTLKTLHLLSVYLIDIHSQFQTADLLKDDFQFNWIDAVANQKQEVELFNKSYIQLNALNHQILKLKEKKSSFQKELDYNTFLFNELNEADLERISLEDLEKEQYLLENAEEVALNISESLQVFDNEEYGLLSSLNEVSNKAKSYTEFISEGESLLERIETLKIESKDIFDELNQKLENIEVNPERLQEVRVKLNEVNQLLQKHQMQELSELIQLREELDHKLQASFSVDEHIEQLTKEQSLLEQRLLSDAKKIQKNREKVVPNIEKEILSSLNKLGMPNAKMSFDLTESETLNPFGKNNIQLLFSANKGIGLNSLEKSVSGGERSRLMLAIKESVAKHKNLPTLILDEIDTGVSGKIAGSMGQIMHEASSNLQIISITHLPQVACFGHQQFKVEKIEEDEVTQTRVVELNAEERITEIAQMLSGEQISDSAINQAKELLNKK